MLDRPDRDVHRNPAALRWLALLKVMQYVRGDGGAGGAKSLMCSLALLYKKSPRLGAVLRGGVVIWRRVNSLERKGGTALAFDMVYSLT